MCAVAQCLNPAILKSPIINEDLPMGYSYFPTRRSAEKWARENLSTVLVDGVVIDTVVIEQLARPQQTDYRKWYVYYPLRAVM